MPRDLFGDVAVRPPSVRSRRSPVVVASIAVHGLVVIGVLLATAIAPDILPTPREALAFYEPTRLIDIQLPPPPAPPRGVVPMREVPTVSPNAAPVVAPTSIVPESWTPVFERSSDGVVDGALERTLGSDIVSVPDALPPAPVVTAPQAPRRMHSGIKAPEKVVNVPPTYPELARQTRVEDIVILETVIDEAGNVTSARVLRGHPLLNQAALDAVQRWKFTPARLNEEAIPVVMTVTVQFKLQ
jgi:periplasmic protein TonB